MDDDGAKDEQQPTSSKKENQRSNSGEDHGSHDDKRKYENRQKYDERGTDAVSNSESFTSSYSARSRLEIAEAKQRGTKAPQKKKQSRRIIGKAEKRKRSATRRRVIRKAPKRKPRVRKDREPSVSTIFTRLTSGSGSHQGCNFCGHRCCRRRLNEKRRRINRRKIVKAKETRKTAVQRKIFSAKGVQVGSRCVVLSPLFVNTNLPTPAELPEAQITYSEITPEMIFESVRKLTMWRQYTQTPSIYQYIKLNYPVNPEEKELQLELDEKLYVATLAGIITKAENGWCLNCRLENRYITRNHVTRFWQIYTDTLKPIERRRQFRSMKNTREVKSVPQNELELLFQRKKI